jgi:translation initiation factor 2 beta subunit (eIF-2beta)/eIF-5
MGTSGYFDQFGRLVMKGRFLSRQIERVMGRYEGVYGEYLRCCGWFIQRTDGLGVVVCKECMSRDTTLRQGERWQVFVKVCTIERTCIREAKLMDVIVLFLRYRVPGSGKCLMFLLGST